MCDFLLNNLDRHPGSKPEERRIAIRDPGVKGNIGAMFAGFRIDPPLALRIFRNDRYLNYKGILKAI